MMNSTSKYLNIPKIEGHSIEGKDYGIIKLNFIKSYGSLSNYNVPWKNIELKEILIDEVLFDFSKKVYMLVDSYKTPIYECTEDSFNTLLNSESINFDVDVYIFEGDFVKGIVFTGLFDKKLYELIPRSR